uniref:methylmalonyl-CoA epimerase n=1 Tax=Vaginimicrobium propionicum TaxID=1871034 RepID=UPI000970ACF7|nr:methylmalonyl-CoA epimerase [Vaginimicrobium propionicum]
MDEMFTCIDHIAYVCPDADEAAKFYVDTLGYFELHRETNDDQGILEIMLAPSKTLTEHMTQIQVISPTRDDASTAKWLEKNRPGLHHMAWRCNDIEAVSKVLRERGMRLIYDEPRIGTGGSKINFIHPKSGKGVLIEIVQPGEAH